MITESENDRHEEFLRLWSRTEHRVRRYIVTLVPNSSDVDDIVQETLVALWRKFNDYRPDRPFDVWACRFAHYQVLSYRKRKSVQAKHLMFSDTVVELLATDQTERSDWLESQQSALVMCLDRLPEQDRELLELRYSTETPISQVARDTNQPVKTLYQALERVRKQLVQCVNIRLKSGLAS